MLNQKTALHFFAERPDRYLEREKLSRYPRANIVLLRPSMSFMLMQTPDPLTLKEALPNFAKTTHIFLPINNNTNVEVAEGGSHWSLLLVSVIDGVAFHYDSLGNDNEEEGHRVTNQLVRLLGKPLKYMHMRDSPQQENGSDCGVFVCLLMEHLLLGKLLTNDTSAKVHMDMKGQHVNATSGRKKMLKVIEEFRREGERRRS
jgi:sentrin-specific protease 8